jgi:glycosyltransferase involved in cell wall biosynthesis
MSVIMVSIIIPHYNRSKLLRNAVNSVLHQTISDWELIIVDDHSEKSEVSKIQELQKLDGRIKILSRRSNYKGPSACRNEGVTASSGEYLIFLDSDDELATFCIEQRVQLMEENKDLHMGIFLMQQFNNTPVDSDTIFNNMSIKGNPVNCFLEGNNPWAVTCPIWRKATFLEIGGFDQQFFFMEDPEIHVRALWHDGIVYKFFYDHPADCYYRINFHDATKIDFYANSIHYRVLFYKKMESLMSKRKEQSHQLKESFQNGVINFFNGFLLTRVKEFPQLEREFIKWANQSNLLSPFTVLKIKTLSTIFRNDNFVFRKFHIKGLAAKILMPVIE